MPGRVHWSQPAGTSDPFIAGATWALSWSLAVLYGPVSGDLLNSLTLSNVERWNGTSWTLVA